LLGNITILNNDFFSDMALDRSNHVEGSHMNSSVQRILTRNPNLLISSSDPTESCSRTTKIDVLPRVPIISGLGQRFILPKGGVPLTQLVEKDGQLTFLDNSFCSEDPAQGYILSLDSEEFRVSNTEQLGSRSRGESVEINPYNPESRKKVTKVSEKKLKLSLCCVCSSNSENHFDVFDDTTDDGNCFSDILVSVMGADIWDTLQQVSSLICDTCAALVSRIDKHRSQLDRDCSQLRDLYQSTEEAMEEDLIGDDNTGEAIQSLLTNVTIECRVLDISQGVVAGHNQMKNDLCCPVLASHTLTSTPSSDNNNNKHCTLFCTPEEWAAQAGSLSHLCAGCMMGPQGEDGHEHLIVLSPRLLDEVLLELDQDGPFMCADCDKTFVKLHQLVCHIQYYHSKEADEASKYCLENEDSNNSEDVADTSEKTGEKPTLEKPFQCESCDKCFGNYSNMMSHVEHYHGWSRQCNVPGCFAKLSSIAEFVTHHVRHADTDFIIPDTNNERNTVVCTCPICKKTSLGVNRHWEHSFIHDKVARFKCPLCDRRVNKVQNLKDHIKRHLGPESKTKECELCSKRFVPSDIYKHMKMVHGKQEAKFPCKICGKTFPVLHKLQLHAEAHL